MQEREEETPPMFTRREIDATSQRLSAEQEAMLADLREQREKRELALLSQQEGNIARQYIVPLVLFLVLLGLGYVGWNKKALLWGGNMQFEDGAFAAIHTYVGADVAFAYLAVPQNRPDWRQETVEVSGTGIDHLIEPGEMFSEEMILNNKVENIDWMAGSQNLQSKLQFLGNSASCADCRWREVITLKEHKATAGVSVKIELVAFHLQSNKTAYDTWKVNVSKDIKLSLQILKQRLESLPQNNNKSPNK